MDLVERFHKVLNAESYDHGQDADLLPVRLVRAVAAVLPADGAGLGVHGGRDVRTPLAANNETAALVERLQFTVGDGPCLRAAQFGVPVLATEEILAARWPVFHDLLIGQTPVRSLVAMPLSGRLHRLGTLSLYFTDPTSVTTVRALDASVVAGLVSEYLGPAADWSAWKPTDAPAGVDTPDAQRRSRVWIAVGMLIVTLRLCAADALALLRSHAYAAGRTVDDLADDLIERRIDPDQLRGTGPIGR